MNVGQKDSLDFSILKPLLDFALNNYHEFELHVTNSRKQMALGPATYVHERFKHFWSNYTEAWDYLEKNTYPYDVPILDTWMNLYTSTDFDLNSAEGEYFGLHQDQMDPVLGQRKTLLHVTSILLEKSDDCMGGYLVLGGDSLGMLSAEERKNDTRDILSRLKVIDMKNPGDCVLWNGETLHGVSEVLKGSRITLMIVKETSWSESYFKRKDYKDG